MLVATWGSSIMKSLEGEGILLSKVQSPSLPLYPSFCVDHIIVGHVLMVQESLYSLSTRSSQLDWKATESIATFPKEAQFVGR